MGIPALSSRVPWTAAHLAWLGALLVIALALRLAHLDYPALFIDEAESAINAMTILEHGYPADEYLGLPIFENTLIRPWPGGHPEYEFRDVSYSDRGAALYHGWLPLFAMAASLKAAGVEPDVPADPPRVQTSLHEMRRRTLAARMPAVVFGTLFVLVAWVAARSMAGRDFGSAAGLIAATMVALAPPAVRVAREARYYSATHAIGLWCCLMVWLMVRDGRWRDHILGGIAFALLFHTHVMTFAVASLAWLLVLPFIARQPGAMPKLATFAGINLLAIVPWVLVTGFPGPAMDLPAARELLYFPQDYVAYLVRHWKLAFVLAVGVLTLASVALLRRRLPERVTRPFLEPAGALVLLLAWLVIGYVAFLALVPAPSAFLWRLTLAVQGPGIVLIAILLAAGARMIGPRIPLVAAAVIGVGLPLMPSVRRPLMAPPAWDQPINGAIAYLRTQQLAPGTRVYATPLGHLTLTFLTGMPVQSTAPVHKQFFDSFDGELVILETAWRGQELPAGRVSETAGAAGVALTSQEASDWAWRLSTRRLRLELADRGTIPEPALEEIPDYLVGLATELAALPPRAQDAEGHWDNPAMFRGYETTDKWGFWQVFFYRFVDPASRSNHNLNYSDRIRGARAVVLDSTWVVFHVPVRDLAATTAPNTGSKGNGNLVGRSKAGGATAR